MGSFFSPPAANVPVPQMQTFQYPGMGEAAGGALGALGQIQGQYSPAAWSGYQQVAGNPYFGGAIGGAQQAAGLGQQQALGQMGWGNFLSNQGAQLYPYAQNIMQAAGDPQNALYARTLQQLQEQTRAGQAARGIATTPYGAGLEAKALSDFNIDWQNQMLNRMVSGAGAAQGLYGQAGSQIAGGQQLGAAAPGQFYQSSLYPYSTQQGFGGAQLDALTKAYGIPAGLAQGYMGYLGGGTAAMNAQNAAANQLYQNQLQQAKFGFDQQQTMFGNLGKAAMFGVGFL